MHNVRQAAFFVDNHDTLDTMLLPVVVDCYGAETVNSVVELDLVGPIEEAEPERYL